MGNEFIAFLVGIFAGTGFLIIVGANFPEYTSLYKMGQIDALSGKIVFVLKDQPDGTRTWERK